MAVETYRKRIRRVRNQDLRKYIESMLVHCRLVDGLWFLGVEDNFGLDSAARVNEEVWAKIGERAARDIRRMFKIGGKGVEAVLQALRYYPWYIIGDYKVTREDGEARIEIPRCPPQEARLRDGRPWFPCKKMHMGVLRNFVNEIDDSLRVDCAFAPPDRHPRDLWCSWVLRRSAETERTQADEWLRFPQQIERISQPDQPVG